MKVVTVIGARPQFIKAAAVSRVLSNCHVSGSTTSVQELVVHTGQHYDYNMSRVFFEELGIPEPHYHLEVGSGSHGHMTGQMLAKVECATSLIMITFLTKIR
jgi:UDP-GlcNAc3NAcA epimerase